MKNKKTFLLAMVRTLFLSSILLLISLDARADYPAILNNVTLSGNTGLSAYAMKKLIANGDQICLWASGGEEGFSLAGCVTLNGATASGSTGEAPYLTRLTASGDRVCLWGDGGDGFVNAGCIILDGATASGTSYAGGYGSNKLITNDNQLCLWGDGGDGFASSGCIAFVGSTYTCPSGGTPSGATCVFPVNGSCGSLNSINLTTAPATPPADSLCDSGTASAVTANATATGWDWTCYGANTGSDASCSANKKSDGACGTSNGLVLAIKPTNNLCSDSSTPDLFGIKTWNWTCPGTNGGSSAGCKTAEDATCIATTNYISTSTGGYACSDGDNLSGTTCSFASTVKYSCPAGETPSADKKTCTKTSTYNATLGGGTNYNLAVWSSISGLASSKIDRNYSLYGYAASSSTDDANKSVWTYNGKMASSKNDRGYFIYGYVASNSTYVNKPVWTSISGMGDSKLDVGYSMYGYIASSAGVYGQTYSCPSGGTLSGTKCDTSTSSPATPEYSCPSGSTLSAIDNTKCEYAAAPTYACSQKCSEQFSYTQMEFISTSATCDAPPAHIGDTFYTKNCACGAKIDPAPSEVNSLTCSTCSDAVATPTFSPAAGPHPSGTKVSISTATDGATIYYTTDGTDPIASSSLYDTATEITLTAAVTIKAIGVKTGLTNSAVASANYTITACTPTYDNYVCSLVSDVACNTANAGQTVRTSKRQCTNSVSNACANNVVLPTVQDCLDNSASCPAEVFTTCPLVTIPGGWREVAP